jgi:hypothetical protein
VSNPCLSALTASAMLVNTLFVSAYRSSDVSESLRLSAALDSCLNLASTRAMRAMRSGRSLYRYLPAHFCYITFINVRLGLILCMTFECTRTRFLKDRSSSLLLMQCAAGPQLPVFVRVFAQQVMPAKSCFCSQLYCVSVRHACLIA